ncbi:rCG63033 [Rattus norvegicus]|uniref:RCG63033 n=1 Tax=Rattus norvegicus TaxID=10116 RepID=A6HWR4_RAT|nr:rCG63033 [Rattus norvegicus]
MISFLGISQKSSNRHILLGSRSPGIWNLLQCASRRTLLLFCLAAELSIGKVVLVLQFFRMEEVRGHGGFLKIQSKSFPLRKL